MSPRVSEAYKQEKRRELLQSARRVFVRKGYTDTTMQDIMDEAGISRGALYAYFDHIDHVFTEVLQFDDQEDIFFFEPDGDSPLWKQITHWVDVQRKSIEGINDSLVRAKAEFFLTSKYVRQHHVPFLEQRYNNLKDTIKGFIEKGAERGEFRPRLPADHISLYFISFIDGLMLNTFQLKTETTNVDGQLSVFQYSLEQMLCPVKEDQG